jgi:hypothetical protein
MSAGKENDGSSKRSEWGAWSKLDKETRDRYEAIEDRVREKMAKGQL